MTGKLLRSTLRTATAIACYLVTPASALDAPREMAGAVAAVEGDIIVTARRVEERLQDVPISITVFDQQQISNRNVVSARDLAVYTPSLAANARFGTENTSFAIRGFTQELRTAPSVAVYFADVVAPRGGGSVTTGEGAGPGSFFDLQNVQVLKGPQGTLFGRNTTGGAILLVPQRPSYDFEGYVEGSYGNYDMKRVQGVINTPLSETVRVRAGFDRMIREGYLENVSAIGPSRFSDVDYIAARASLIVDLTPDLENYTIASYTRSDTNGQVPKIDACFPAGARGPLFGGILSCDQIERESAISKGFYAVSNGFADPKLFLEQWQIINTSTWTASDTLTIKNVASYGRLRNKGNSEAFGTVWRIPEGSFLGQPTGSRAGRIATFSQANHAVGLSSAFQSTFSEEVQLQGRSSDGRFIWQTGGYLELSEPLQKAGNQNPSNLACIDADTFQCADVIGSFLGREGQTGTLSYQVGKSSHRNIGIYAQGTYAITDALKLTGGLRYTWDRTRSEAQKLIFRFPSANDPRMYCLDSTVGPAGPVRDPVSQQLRFDNALPMNTLETACLQKYEQTSKAPTWVIGVEYKPSDDALLYAKYSRGYRQGSTNPYGANGFETFEPEKVDAYEVGVKTSFKGGLAGSFNIAGFYNDFKDQQIQIGVINSTGSVAPNTAIVNAGKSRIYGTEIELSLSPFDGFTVDASYAYLNTKLVELTPTALPPGSLYDTIIFTSVEGGPLTFAPKHKASATATYRLPLSERIGRVSVGATFTITDRFLVTGRSAFGYIPSNELLNLNLTWSAIGGSPIDASLFATNVTNEKYYTHVVDQVSAGFLARHRGEPRIYGLRLRLHFGN